MLGEMPKKETACEAVDSVKRQNLRQDKISISCALALLCSQPLKTILPLASSVICSEYETKSIPTPDVSMPVAVDRNELTFDARRATPQRLLCARHQPV